MKNEKGFTLIEVVLATAILLVVMGAVLQLFISHIRAAQATENYLVVSEHNQRALQTMAEEIRGTDYEFVNVSFSGSQGAKTLPSLTPGGSSISVNLYDSITFKRITGFDTATASQTWSDNITFQLNTTNKQVERVEAAGTPTVLASYSTALSFYNAPGRIGIILTTSHGDFGERATGAQVENRIEIYPENKGTD
jgi:prepilin-type N-terminal cleavage/methylation domain-containing protein